MTEDQIVQIIKQTVGETIGQLRKQGLLRSASDLSYRKASEMLSSYYAEDGERRRDVTEALKEFERDKYIKIIPLYYYYHYTLEEIAEEFDVEVSTISRNKKRLALAIYNRIGE